MYVCRYTLGLPPSPAIFQRHFHSRILQKSAINFHIFWTQKFQKILIQKTYQYRKAISAKKGC